jgi:hypothetical protein
LSHVDDIHSVKYKYHLIVENDLSPVDSLKTMYMKYTLLFLLCFVLCGCPFKSSLGDKYINVIELKGKDCTLYIKEVQWGFTGGHRRFYLGTSNELSDTIHEAYLKSDFFFKFDSLSCKLLIANEHERKIFREYDSTCFQKVYDKIGYDNYDQNGYRAIVWE